MPIPITLIGGDGIGPEIMEATLSVLSALQAPFEWHREVAGLEGIRAAGDPLPPATLESIRRTRLALKGPLETPSGGGYRSSNVRLREEFKLYANLRPARTLIPGGRFDNIDLVVVRENLEGLYIGYEHYIEIDADPHAVAMATASLSQLLASSAGESPVLARIASIASSRSSHRSFQTRVQYR